MDAAAIRRRLALVVAWLAAAIVGGGAVASAAAPFVDVPITAGSVGLAGAVGMDTPPDPPRLVGEVARFVYDVPEGRAPEVDAKVRRLHTYVDLLRQFDAALAAARPNGGAITLALARQTDERERLSRLFELVGLKLSERGNVYSVERSRKVDADHTRLLTALHLDIQTLADRLNAGEPVTIDVSTESIPVPLSAELWSQLVFKRRVEERELVLAILADRNASLLCRGLAGLDAATLAFFETQPALITHLYDRDATIFGGFSDSLRVRNGQVVVSGGEEATRLWEWVVGEKTTRPDRFIEKLFSETAGRLAFLYSTIDHLDAPRRAFALGLWIPDANRRRDRFTSLAAEAVTDFGDWHLTSTPFRRVPFDLAMLLAQVRVEPDGAPVEPRARTFWTRAFSTDTTVPDDVTPLKDVQTGEDIDAGWLAQRVSKGDARVRQRLLEQLTFGERVFGGARDDNELSNALVAVRVYPQFPMLMSALDRVGARRPTTFVAAARHASRLSTLDPDHAFVALSQFEGAIALLVRLTSVRALAPENAETLAGTLAVLTNDAGWYQGGVAHWVRGPLAQALHLDQNDLDAGLMTALAGRTAGPSAPTIRFEGEWYRIDLAQAERRRLEQLSAKTSRVPIDTIFVLDGMADRLARASTSLDPVRAVTADLKRFMPPPGRMVGPPKVDLPKQPREILDRAVKDLSEITQANSVQKAVGVSETLERLVDDLLADSLRSLVYAIDLGDPERVIEGLDSSARHDFGFGLPLHDDRMPWTEARQQLIAGVPWHLRGSLLNLDLGLAKFALTRVSNGESRSGTLTDNERETFAQSAALFNPFAVRDNESDLVAESIERGRTRVRSLGPAPSADALEALRTDVGIDGWRLRAVEWSLGHGRDPLPFFSLSELLQAGGAAEADVANRWGPTTRRADGCVCSHIGFPNQGLLIAGRPELGVLATEIPDLGLRVALGLHELGLPAVLARGVLVAATRDFIDIAKPNDPADWLTLVRTAQGVSRERVEDYVAGLTTGGPLVPVPAPGAAR